MDTKTRPLHMLSTRDPPQNRGHIQTESEGLLFFLISDLQFKTIQMPLCMFSK